MRVDGVNQNAANNIGSMGANEEAVIQKKIQSLKKELGELNKKDNLSKEEAKKKKDIEQEIAELEQKLQQIKAKKRIEKEEKQDKSKTDVSKLKEDGKGENIDERL